MLCWPPRCGRGGDKYGYEYGFALPGLGMLVGLLFFIGGQNTYRQWRKHLTR